MRVMMLVASSLSYFINGIIAKGRYGNADEMMTTTSTPTSTSTFTQTETPTFTQTATPTFTQTQTPTFTQTATPTFTSTATMTFTQTATPTQTFTRTATPTQTTTSTATFTATTTPTVTATITATFTSTTTFTVTFTPTSTPEPPVSLALLPSSIPVTAVGNGTAMTLEVLNTSGQPATLATALTLSLTSSSTGEYVYSLTSGGAQITTVNFLAGTAAQTQVYYRDAKAGNWNLSTSSLGFSAATTLVQVVPGPYVGLQVLLPGETTDPGRPIADPLGHLGSPTSASAGSGVPVNLAAVDSHFNAETSINDAVTLSLTDPAVPQGGTLNLSAGTGTKSVAFFSPGNQAVTAVDLSDGTKKGVSDLITITSGTTSTLLDVVHTSPALSGEGLGATGVTFMTFQLTVVSGTDTVQLNDLVVHAKDSSGSDVSLNTAFQSLSVLSGAQTFLTSVGSISSAVVTLGAFPAGTFLVQPGTPVTLVLTGDISSGATAKNVSLSVDGPGSIVAIDKSTSTAVAALASGDPTGFPMSSGLLELEPADVSKTYGNYPNPFRPGVENTTLEFYLPAPSTVSLVLYDLLGNKVLTLLNGQNLPTGLQRQVWNGRNGTGRQVLSGVYYAQLTVNGTNYLLKVAVVK